MAASTPWRKSASRSQSLASAFDKSRPRPCANCAIHRVRASCGLFWTACGIKFSFPGGNSPGCAFIFTTKESTHELILLIRIYPCKFVLGFILSFPALSTKSSHPAQLLHNGELVFSCGRFLLRAKCSHSNREMF